MRQSLYDYCIENKRGDLLREWDAEANLPLTPETVTSGSHHDIRWLCENGHRWTAKPYARTAARSRCPVCAGKKILPGVNDLKTLVPEAVTPQSNQTVWWRCEKGHDYQTTVALRVAQGRGCPYCANRKVLPGFNDLAFLVPEVAAEWHPSRNGALTPQDVTCGSVKKVWWKCRLCSYE